MYIFTFGSNEGNSHVHWHVVPLPPGIPYDQQQGEWASWGMGVLKIPQEEMASLAMRIGRRVEGGDVTDRHPGHMLAVTAVVFDAAGRVLLVKGEPTSVMSVWVIIRT